jgi:AraC-like DNA-binding protein
MAGGFDIGGDWAVQFPQHQGIKCYAVGRGHCFLSVEGVEGPVPLEAGDCFLLPRGRPFVLASDLALAPVDALTLLRGKRNGGITIFNGGGDFFLAGGYFTFAGPHASLLLSALPPIAHIRSEADRAALRWSLDRMQEELSQPRPGGALITQHLAYMMLVQALRLHLAAGPQGGVGWLFALADRQMSAAIGAMHAEPAQRWTLEALAAHAGMSRSAFAARFKETVGATPMEYLTRWRMLLAGDRLVHSGEPVSVIAPSLGYESESAFSTAFKRVMGCAPRQYGRARHGRNDKLSNETAALGA